MPFKISLKHKNERMAGKFDSHKTLTARVRAESSDNLTNEPM